MKITLKVWRQKDQNSKGAFQTYQLDDVSSDMSFLEMFDVLNNDLILKGEEPIAFDHDCREGICGACSMYINGRPHGPLQTTTCQLHMRSFKDGETITVEPWRAREIGRASCRKEWGSTCRSRWSPYHTKTKSISTEYNHTRII